MMVAKPMQRVIWAVVLVLGLAVVFWPFPVLADSCTWDGSTGNWSDSGHWSCGHPPGAGDTAAVPSGTVTVDGDVAVFGLTQSGGTVGGAHDLTVTDAFAWTGGTQSGTGTTVVPPGATLTLSSTSAKTLSARILDLQGTTTWTAGTLRLRNAATIENSGAFEIQGDMDLDQYYDGLSTFTNTGWLGKTAGSGTAYVEMHFHNAGSVEVQAGTLQVGYSSAIGTSSGSFAVSSGATLRFSSGSHTLASGSSVSGAGTVWFSGATVTVLGTYNLSGTTEVTGGTVNVEAGATMTSIGQALLLSGGTLTLNSGEPANPTTMEQSGGTLSGSDTVTVANTFDWTGGTQSGTGTTAVAPGASLNLSGGTKTLDGRTLQQQGTAIWAAGNIYVVNAATINNSGSLDAQSDADVTRSGEYSTFTNSGSFVKSGGSDVTSLSVCFYNAGSVEVQTGTLGAGLGGADTHSGSFIVSAGATVRFQSNAHTLVSGSSVSGAGKVRFEGATVTVLGTYNVSGTTEVTGGTVTFEPGATVTSIGQELTVGGGTLTLNSGEAINPTTMTQSYGTLSGADTVTVGSAFAWTGGTQTGTGATVVPPGATLTLSGSSTKALNGRTLDLQGTTTWTGGTVSVKYAATIENSGAFDIQGDMDLDHGGGDLTTFANTGWLGKTAGSGTSYVEMHFHNTGTVEVQIGILQVGASGAAASSSGSFTVSPAATLRFHGGSHTLDSSSSVSGGGTVWFSAGTLTVLGSYDLSGTTEVTGGSVTFQPGATVASIGDSLVVGGGTLNLDSGEAINPTIMTQSSGTLSGADTVEVGTAFAWTGGTQTGTGTTVAPPGATLTLSGSNTKALNGRTLDLQGTSTWTGGTVSVKSAATIENSGAFDIQGDMDLDHGGGSLCTFTNSGWLGKTAGSGTSYVEMHFHNTGSVEVQIGTLQVGYSYSGSTGTSSGSFTVSSGATLRFSNGSHTLASGSSVSGSGRVLVSGGTVTVLGSYDLGGTTEVTGGTMTFEPGATMASVGESLVVNGGTLNLDSGEAVNPTIMTQSSGTLSGADTVEVGTAFGWTGGTQRGTGTTVVPAGATLTLSGGTKSLNGRILDLQGTTIWTAGGVRVWNAATIENSGTLDIQGDMGLDHGGGDRSTFTNSGWLGKTAGSGTSCVKMNFHNTGSVEVQIGTLQVGYNGSTGTSTGSFTVSSGATLRFSNGNHTLASGSSVSGGGRVLVSGETVTVLGSYELGGTTEVNGGTMTFELGATVLSIGQELTVGGGTLTLNSGEAINPTMLTQSSGTLSGADTVTAGTTFDWTGGTESGTGTTVVPPGATLTLSGSSTKTLNGRSLHLQGTTTWTGGTVSVRYAAIIENSGAFDIQGDMDLDHYSGEVSTFNNSGWFGKTAGSGTAYVEMHFHNAGSVEVQIGTLQVGCSSCADTSSGSFAVSSGATLRFSSGSHTLASGSTVSGAGTMWFSGGTMTVLGTYNLGGTTDVGGGTVDLAPGASVMSIGDSLLVRGGTLNMNSGEPITPTTMTQSSGTLGGADTVEVSAGFSWTGGTQTGAGITRVAMGAVLDLSGSNKTLDGRTLELQGAAGWTAGTLNLKNAANIDNRGTFDLHGDLYLHHYSGEYSTLYNSGQFSKTAGSGTAELEMHVHNDGLLGVERGTLTIGCGGCADTSHGTFDAASGTTLQFSSGTHTLASGSLVQGDGRVWLSGGTLAIGGTYDVHGTTRVTGGTADFDHASSLTFGDLAQSGGTLNMDNNASLSGDWTRDAGGLHPGTGSVTFAGPGEQAIGGSVVTSFYDLVVASGAIVSIPTTNTPSVAGVLSNNGTLKQTRNLDNSGGACAATYSFLQIQDDGETDKYFGVEITIEPGANLGSTVVYVHGNQSCGFVNAVQRCYEIDPADAGFLADIRFYYRASEANGNTWPYAWQLRDGVWTALGPFTTRGWPHPEAYWVQVTCVANCYPFALADDPAALDYRIWVPLTIR